MQRFKKILFIHEPGASTASSLQRAVKLAQNNHAQLTLCSVSAEIPRTFPNIKKTFNEIHKQQLTLLLDNIDVNRASIKTRLLCGTAFIEIIKEVKRGSHDLVIKSAEGQGGLSNALFGSTDMHLMRKCPCPVWIMKPTKRKKYARILAAVDIDSRLPANTELNKMILDLALSQALEDNSELHIVHAWNFPYEDLFRSKRVPQLNSDVDQLVREKRQETKLILNELLNDFNLQNIVSKVHLIKGDPGHIIPGLAQKKKVELIVMGTIARTGIPGFFIGNTAERVLANVDCSVLTVKPKSFKTPI